MLRLLLLLVTSPLLGAATQKTPKDMCRKYEGAYISYYEHVFLVKGCQRRAVAAQQELYNLTRRGVVVQEVEAAVIRAIPLAPESKPQAAKTASPRLCRALQGQYITRSFVDIYYIDNCHKRLLPNWETYQQHLRDRGKLHADILSLNRTEFLALKLGKAIPPVTRESVPLPAEVDVIPIDEACKGVEGKYVSYYTKIYRIKDCHRHEIDAEVVRRGKLNITRELTSEQWLSLPMALP